MPHACILKLLLVLVPIIPTPPNFRDTEYIKHATQSTPLSPNFTKMYTNDKDHPIEAGAATGSDEDYSSGAESDTISLSSSVVNYEYENGRRYHAYNAGKYALPNDEVNFLRGMEAVTDADESRRLNRIDWI